MAQPIGIEHENGGNAGIDVKQHVNGFGTCVGRQNERHIAHHLVQLKRLRIQHQLTCLYLGKIKNVIEQTEQRIRRPARLGNVIGLLKRQLRPFQQTEHAQHRVQRGPNFVTHVGQKATLGQ